MFLDQEGHYQGNRHSRGYGTNNKNKRVFDRLPELLIRYKLTVVLRSNESSRPHSVPLEKTVINQSHGGIKNK